MPNSSCTKFNPKKYTGIKKKMIKKKQKANQKIPINYEKCNFLKKF